MVSVAPSISPRDPSSFIERGCEFGRRWHIECQQKSAGLLPLIEEGITIIDPSGTRVLTAPNPEQRVAECGLASSAVCMSATQESLGKVERVVVQLAYSKPNLAYPSIGTMGHAVTQITSSGGDAALLVDPTPLGELLGFSEGVLPPKLLHPAVVRTATSIPFGTFNCHASFEGGVLNLDHPMGRYAIANVFIGTTGDFPLQTTVRTGTDHVILVTGGINLSPQGLVELGYNVHHCRFDQAHGLLRAHESFMADGFVRTRDMLSLYDQVNDNNEINPASFAEELFKSNRFLNAAMFTVQQSPNLSSAMLEAIGTQGRGLYFFIKNLLVAPRLTRSEIEARLEKLGAGCGGSPRE